MRTAKRKETSQGKLQEQFQEELQKTLQGKLQKTLQETSQEKHKEKPQTAETPTAEIQTLEIFFRPDGFLADLVPAAERRGTKQISPEEMAAQKEWYGRFSANRYEALYYLGFLSREAWMTPGVAWLRRLSEELLKAVSSRPEIELMREQTEVSFDQDLREMLLDALPYANGAEFVDGEWLRSVWDRLLACFRREIAEYDGTVAGYFMERNSRIGVAGRIFFHLVENKDEDYPFAFMATYSTRPVKSKKAMHKPLKNALLEFRNDREKLLALLSAVAKAADGSALLAGLMESGELFSPLRFTAKEAYTFLTEIPLYEAAGVMCRVPDWWKKKTNRLKLTVSVGQKEPSKVGMDALLDFRPALTIDGETVTVNELREFLKQAEGLTQYKGKWIEINKSRLEAALAAFEKAEHLAAGGQVTVAEAMRLELNLDKELGGKEEPDAVEYGVTNGQWLKEVRERLLHPGALLKEAPEPSLHATLRPYQEVGYSWLSSMGQLGFGACLADDMGLGKTVQVIAYLEHARLHRGGRALLIVPASLLGNWEKELERFAPEMSYQRLHKSAGSRDALELDENKFLTITTYGMAGRMPELAAKPWDLLILDEAQAIKNAGTKQSKSVKAIPSKLRLAMTGTPIENRLGDLWSLFDFLNPGLLGTAKEFTDFTKRLNDEEEGYARLKRMVNPFILRRLKTDRSIIADLPDKLEIKEYAGLSKKQAILYQKLVDEIGQKLSETEEAERKGLILSSIIKFKQICNHPDQYLGQDEFKKENSGKFEQLEQICGTIYEKRERVLVFTQFREMTEPLSDFLAGIFHRRGLVLHGGTPVKKRAEMVDAFNGETYVPYMVLSLKAGGVGLNLTGANHVVHFDRWWNPAVENQATDRAFRIGQTKDVMVHKFVTKGTIEEKIDAMIEDKQRLAGEILSASGESWIAQMDDTQIMDLFRLGGD